MSTLSVDTIQGKTTAGTVAMPAGMVIQTLSFAQDGNIDKKAPISFLTSEEQGDLFDDKKRFRISLYKAFLFIHIADATAKEIHKRKVKKVLFLGTKYSMEETFITKRIEDNGIEVLVPEDQKVIDELHRIIIEELTYGNIVPSSKDYVMEVIKNAKEQGADGVVLGCTEFPLMIFPEDVDIAVFNTTKIHSDAGVNYILKK